MKSSWHRNDPQVLLAFLYDLICNVKRPEETGLLVEVVLNIQEPRSMPRSTLCPAVPIDRPPICKQGHGDSAPGGGPGIPGSAGAAPVPQSLSLSFGEQDKAVHAKWPRADWREGWS